MSQHAVINASAAGDNTIVSAGNANQKIRVLSYVLVAAAGVSVTWKSGTGGSTTAKSGAMPLIAGTPLAVADSPPGAAGPRGHIETLPGEALNLSLSGAVLVAGHLTYVLIST